MKTSPSLVLAQAQGPGWHDALQARFIADFGDQTLWGALEDAYMAPERHYHTLAHLSHLFALYDQLAMRITWRGAYRMALWFHDWVYETGRPSCLDNERRSAEVLDLAGARRLSERGELPLREPFQRALADAFILATRHHTVDASMFALQPAARADCQLFIDTDLAILACTPAQVQAYDDAIRAEYGEWSDTEYATARAAALESFLTRDRIFLSEPFMPWEGTARDNVEMLLARWRRQGGRSARTSSRGQPSPTARPMR